MNSNSTPDLPIAGKSLPTFVLCVLASIVSYVAVIFMAVFLMPDNPITESFGVTVAFLFASMMLVILFSRNPSFTKSQPIYVYIAPAAAAALGILMWRFPQASKQVQYLFYYSSWGRVTYIVFLCILSPIAEEIYFRGLLFPLLMERLNPLPSAAITVALFVVNHNSWNQSLISLGLSGCLYTWLAYKTKSTIPSITCHITYNAGWVIAALS